MRCQSKNFRCVTGKRVFIVAAAATILVLCITKRYRDSDGLLPPEQNRLGSNSDLSLSISPDFIRDYEAVEKILMKTDAEVCKNKTEWGGIDVLIPIMGKYEPKKAGNYSICMDEAVMPPVKNCLTYTFGIQNEWSFEESAEDYGCTVYSFDPSMGNKSFLYSLDIHFSPVGLSNFDGIVQDGPKKGWEMARLATLLKSRKHENRIIDVLKVDVEDDEHVAIPDMIASGLLENVKQLVWEIHLPENLTLEKYYSTYWLLERVGFKKFHAESWNHDACIRNGSNYCFIFSHLNTKFLINKT